MTRYRPIFATLLIVAGFAVASAQPAQAETLLRWKFESGQKHHMVVTQEMQMKMVVQDQPTSMTTTSNIDNVWEVTAVDEQGVATISQKIDRVQMKMQGPQGVMMEYDSESEKKPEGMAAMIASMFETMVDKPYNAKMDSRGQVIEMELPQGLAESLSKMPGGGQIGGLLSEDGMKTMAEIATLPEEPVKEGDTWTRSATMKTPMIGDTTIDTTFRYAGTETRDGRELEKIEVAMKMQYGEGDGNVAVKLTDQNTKGAIYFDNEQGRFVSSDTTMTMKMQISTMGQTIEQDMVVKSKTETVPQ